MSTLIQQEIQNIFTIFTDLTQNNYSLYPVLSGLMAENRNRVCALRAVCQSLVWEEFGSNVCLAAFGCSIESVSTVSYDNVSSCNKVENVLNDLVADSF